MQRKLAAVLAADVVGYSKLMGEDEAGTLSALHEHRLNIFDPLTAEHGGRIFKLMGDGTLVEFPSVVDAVECALAIQKSIAEDPGPIKLRIGVNLGDMIIDGEDFYGNGVNIAARLETLADSGGICISSIVHESLGNQVQSQFSDAGEYEVKNITRPISVFKWPDDGFSSQTAQRPAPLKIADKPTIAILAFDNLSGDPEQAFFADGITEDIITELSRYGELTVIARNSSFAFKGQALNARQVGVELGAGYVVEGSVRRSGNRVRVTAQLIDCTSDGHVWAERYDRDLTDIFDVQDEITQAIVAALGAVVQDTETQRAIRNVPSNLAAYDEFLRAWKLMLEITQQTQSTAKAIAEHAIELDPRYSRPHSVLSMYHCVSVFNGWSQDFESSIEQAWKCAQTAVTLDHQDAWAHSFLGFAELWRRNFDRALLETTRGVELNPNFADGYAWLAVVHSLSAERGRGLEHIAMARKLNPRAPAWYSIVEARGNFLIGDYSSAIQLTEETLAELPDFTTAIVMAAVVSAALDRQQDAEYYAGRIRQVAPNYKLSAVHKIWPFKEQSDFNHYMKLARQAGLPE